MKKILGLDLGTTSIGWAIINEAESDKEKNEILGMGCRIVPLSPDDKSEFESGNAISKNQKRTQRRTQRKGYNRYQQRRAALTKELIKMGMMPDEDLFKLTPLELWGLRAKAVYEQISLKELGRILYHLNQKRGYKSSRKDENLDKKDTDYVTEVKGRQYKINELGLTIGQYFYSKLQYDERYRIKDQVFPREAYIDEFDKIWHGQKNFYPEILTDDAIQKIRNEIIYYQRSLKSCKHLISICEFEGKNYKNQEGKWVFNGPKVAPKSSPIFQLGRIWETINNLSIKSKYGLTIYATNPHKKKLRQDDKIMSQEERLKIFEWLDNNEKLTFSELIKILKLKKDDGWFGNKQISKGIPGNSTKRAIIKSLDGYEKLNELIRFNIEIEELEEIDKTSGEILLRKQLSPKCEYEPLYQLWHCIYSIHDKASLISILKNKFQIPDKYCESISKIDFTKMAFGNKSAKATRKISPYLMSGSVYSDACFHAGYSHSDSLTKEENKARELLDKLPILQKNSLRQPIVEKILNHMINVVNAIIGEYGKPDEIRIELARELKQSKEERNDAYRNINKRERENNTIKERLSEYNLPQNRRHIEKWRLFHEISNDESKLNSICLYCGQPFGITQALKGHEVDIEHILPQSRIFDDSFQNKTLVHRKCNANKGNMTAFDFMKMKSKVEFENYIERVNKLYESKLITKAKRDKLLMPVDEIPQDFIDRQLRQTQYISRKSREILSLVCHNIFATSGSVTEKLRHLWGWDMILHDLNFEKYKSVGLTEFKIIHDESGNEKKIEVIKDWTKRDDHRHHAIDALTIACTKQGYIQRINRLNSDENRDEMYQAIKESRKFDLDEKISDKIKTLEEQARGRSGLLDEYFKTRIPFSYENVKIVTSGILISFKAGKKVASKGIRKIHKGGKSIIVQKEGILIPRGALSEESVYGKIKTIEKNKPVKYLFENPHLIFKPHIKQLIEQRLQKFENDQKKALASLKKEPIYLDDQKQIELKTGTCFSEEFVIKYPLSTIKKKDIDSVIDEKVRDILLQRIEQLGEKEAFKDIENNPVYFNREKNIKIRTVRFLTGLDSQKIAPVRFNDKSEPIGFVKPGNNHHIAIYKDSDGNLQEHICTFWHAVQRKMDNISVIIENPKNVWSRIIETKQDYPESFIDKLPNDDWEFIMSMQQNEMFVFGLNKDELINLIQSNNKKIISDNLYLCQKLNRITDGGWYFIHHIETRRNLKTVEDINAKRLIRITSLKKFNPIKVRITNLGKIEIK